MANKQPMSDSDILVKVLAKSRSAVGWFDSKLSKERQRVTDYYNGKLPYRQHAGSSSYVSTDVYDAVEMLKSQLLETFAGGESIAQFDPDKDMNVPMCRAATQYATYVIFRENNGFNVFHDAIHDGLTARVGVAMVYWKEKFDYAEETFEGLMHDDAMALASQEDVDEFDASLDESTGLYSGTLVRKFDHSHVCIEPLATEEFLIEARASSLDAAGYKGHRMEKTRAELYEMGYKKSLVDSIRNDTITMSMAPESQSRNNPTLSNLITPEPVEKTQEQILYFQSFVRMTIDQAKGARLYKICHAGDTLLDKQEVDRAPYFAYVPLPVPHVFYGNNFAARVIPTQNARTVLTRGVLDHTAITTNPKYMVVNGGLMNPKEMLENRLGGLVNVRRPDSVTAFPQNNLNPFVFQTLGMLKEDKEQSTGISSLSQGLNKDAISTQNSQGLVDNMVSLSSQRQKIAARNFAYNFFVPIMLEVVRLGIINEKKPKMIEVAGEPIEVDPRTWTERTTCTVSMHLGYGEKDKAVVKHTQAYEMLAKDPMLQNAFGIKQRIMMAHDTMKLAGLSNFSSYLDPNAQAPGPNPLQVRELDIKDKVAQAALLQGQAAVDKDKRVTSLDASRLALDQNKNAVSALEQDRTQDRHDIETAHKIDIAEREMVLAEEAPITESKAIISPN